MSKKHIKTNKTIYTTVNDDYQNILTTQTFDCMGTACSSNFNLEYAAIRNYKHWIHDASKLFCSNCEIEGV